MEIVVDDWLWAFWCATMIGVNLWIYLDHRSYDKRRAKIEDALLEAVNKKRDEFNLPPITRDDLD